RPGERKFLGFSISNDGSERRIAPKALDKFKGRIRDMTRRTRGFGLQQLIKELKPYIVGWRGYFGFCQTPRVLTNLEAWIRRRLRLYLWRQWRTGQTASKNCAIVAYRSSMQRWRQARPRASGECQDTRRSNRRCATAISTRSVSPESTRPPKLNSIEPPRYGSVWCGRGGAARHPPIPILDYHLPFWPCLVGGMALAAAAGAGLGFSTLRLGGHYLAMVTISFQEILTVVLINATRVTDGPDRVSSIARPAGLASGQGFLALVVAVLALSGYFVWHLADTRLGRAMRAVRDNELAAGAAGVDVFRTKVIAFAL